MGFSLGIGFDLSELLTPLTGDENYTVHKTGDNAWVIEMPIPGYGKEDVSVEVLKNVITVKGDKGNVGFTQEFRMTKGVELKKADIANGVLTINIERPMAEKPKKIELGDNPEVTKK